VLGLDAFELDGDFLTRDDVGAQVNIAERTRADLATDAVLITDAEILNLSLADELDAVFGLREFTYHRRHFGGWVSTSFVKLLRISTSMSKW
jgi:hypothetical protein